MGNALRTNRPGGLLSDEGYTSPQYPDQFFLCGRWASVRGSYRATIPQECGPSFEILYDPENPSGNTGSDMDLCHSPKRSVSRGTI